jgi:hypothetical protein
MTTERFSNDLRRDMALRALAALIALILFASPSAAQSGDPQAPGAIALFEIGRMHGGLKDAANERFGRTLYSLGDVNNDGLGDWILAHRRYDTIFDGYAVVELLLFTGVRGGLPPTSAGLRIGPSEIKADCGFVGAGDYDGDGHRDIVIKMRVLDDPHTLGWWITSVVVFWGDGTGRFGIDDTTHLTGPTERLSNFDGTEDAVVAIAPTRSDLDGDGVDDLLMLTKGRRFVAMVLSPAPYMMIYRGHRGGRWGRNGISTRPDWQLWQKHFVDRVSVLDHDGDGVLDVAMFIDWGSLQPPQVNVLYGARGGLPDTVAERIEFPQYESQPVATCEFVDVTGDRVPELITALVDTVDNVLSLTRRWLVYVGRRGQRLREQFGSGDDAPHPGDSLWWGRPWTILMPPSAFSTSWVAPARVILDPGDIGLDGVGDFCAESWPTVVCYNGGAFLDSKFDAWISNVWLASVDVERLVQLGDIDGSRLPALGVAMAEGGVAFIRADRRVPRGGDSIRLPEGSDRPVSSAPLPAPSDSGLDLTIAPNPATAVARLQWPARPSAASSVVLLDPAGRELRRWMLPLGVRELSIALGGMPAGIYFVSLRSDGRVATTAFLHAE